MLIVHFIKQFNILFWSCFLFILWLSHCQEEVGLYRVGEEFELPHPHLLSPWFETWTYLMRCVERRHFPSIKVYFFSSLPFLVSFSFFLSSSMNAIRILHLMLMYRRTLFRSFVNESGNGDKKRGICLAKLDLNCWVSNMSKSIGIVKVGV